MISNSLDVVYIVDNIKAFLFDKKVKVWYFLKKQNMGLTKEQKEERNQRVQPTNFQYVVMQALFPGYIGIGMVGGRCTTSFELKDGVTLPFTTYRDTGFHVRKGFADKISKLEQSKKFQLLLRSLERVNAVLVDYRENNMTQKLAGVVLRKQQRELSGDMFKMLRFRV